MRFGKLEVTSGFLLLTAWLNYLDKDFVIPMAAAACAAHELGHFAAIRLLGGDIKLIRLTSIGAEMVLARPLGYWQEGLSALAGPGVNLMLALLFCHVPGGFIFSGINFVLALFNLLPIGKLDGGRTLFCAAALLAGPEPALWIGRRLDVLCTGAVLAAGLALAGIGRNITLLLVAFWLLAGLFQQNNFLRRGNRACQRDRKQVQ